jgi:hypothetical protein
MPGQVLRQLAVQGMKRFLNAKNLEIIVIFEACDAH